MQKNHRRLPPEKSAVQEFMTPADLATYLAVTPRQVDSWRQAGIGPPFVKLHEGRRGTVRYRRSTVDAWAAERERQSTRDTTTRDVGEAAEVRDVVRHVVRRHVAHLVGGQFVSAADVSAAFETFDAKRLGDLAPEHVIAFLDRVEALV